MKKNLKEKALTQIEYIGFVFYIFGVPIILYFFAKWDPFISYDEYGDPIKLGAWPIIIVYWVLIYLVHKYNNERKSFKHTLEWVLEVDRKLSQKERASIRKEIGDIEKYYEEIRKGIDITTSSKSFTYLSFEDSIFRIDESLSLSECFAIWSEKDSAFKRINENESLFREGIVIPESSLPLEIRSNI